MASFAVTRPGVGRGPDWRMPEFGRRMPGSSSCYSWCIKLVGFYRLATASRAKVCRGHSVGRDSPERSRAFQAYSEVERSSYSSRDSHRDWGSTALGGIGGWAILSHGKGSST